jgi:hypothetical protein
MTHPIRIFDGGRIAQHRCRVGEFFTALVRLGVILQLAGGFAPADSQVRAQVEPVRRTQENWLKLEADRRAYSAAQPKSQVTGGGGPLDLRLQQQGLRDRLDLLPEGAAAARAPQLRRLPPDNRAQIRGADRLRSERLYRSLELNNRIQRRSWAVAPP